MVYHDLCINSTVTGAMLSSTNDRSAAKRMVFPVGLFGTLRYVNVS